MNVQTTRLNLDTDETAGFHLQNSKHYTEQMRSISGLG